MSETLFKLQPERMMDRAKEELAKQAGALRAVAVVLERPGLTVDEMTEVIESEMPMVRTGLALARNFMVEALRERELLEPVLELFHVRVEGRGNE